MAAAIRLQARDLQLAIREGRSRAANLQPAFEVIGNDLVRSVQRNFDEEGRPKWTSLARSTIAQRARIGKSGKILTRTGRLRNSVRYQAQKTGVRWGTNTRYAGVHQFGSRDGRIPLRDYLTPQDSDLEAAAETVLDHLAEPFA